MSGWLIEDIKTTAHVIKAIETKTQAKVSELTKIFEKASPLALFSIYQLCDEKWKKDAILNYVNEWKYVKPRIKGSDLKEMGLLPGPKFKSILEKITAAILDGEIKNEDQEMAMLDELLNDEE